MTIIKAADRASDFKVALVVGRFNHEITQALHEGALSRLLELGFQREQLTTTWVPGAVEIPLVAQQFLQNQAYPVVIALGAVIRGETSHYDYVCEQVSQGCQQLMLQHQKPIIFGVLTTENQAQALDRIGGAHGHKGREAADAAFEMVSVLQQVQAHLQVSR